MIGSGEGLVGGRVQQVGGVGGFALDAEQDIEGGSARGGDGHGCDCSGRKPFTTEDTEEHRGTLGAQIFAWFGAVALDEVVRGGAFFSFELDFQKVERGVVGAAD